VIIPCYLPNEYEIIMETVNHFLQESLIDKVIVVYNTPIKMSIEIELKAIENNRFKCINVIDSTSRAENLAFVLNTGELSTETILLVDADHRSETGSINTMLEEYINASERACCIQASIGVRGESCFARILDTFGLLSGIFLQPCLEMVGGSALYIGAGSLWNAKVLREYSFSCITSEDIDLTFRIMLQTLKVKGSLHGRFNELAPRNCMEFIKQRTRWVAGFEECRRIYFWRFLRQPRIYLMFCYIYMTYFTTFINVGQFISSLCYRRFPSIWASIPVGVAVFMLLTLCITLVFLVIKDTHLKKKAGWLMCGLIGSPAFAFFQTTIFIYALLRRPCPIKNHVTLRSVEM